MYWTDADTGKIQRANLDGTAVEDLVVGLDFPDSLTLDVPNGKMYWTDRSTVERANLDGSDVERPARGRWAPSTRPRLFPSGGWGASRIQIWSRWWTMKRPM